MAFFSQDKNQSTKSVRVDTDNYLVSIATREAGNGTVWGLCLQEDQLFAPVKGRPLWEKHESVVVVGVLLIF